MGVRCDRDWQLHSPGRASMNLMFDPWDWVWKFLFAALQHCQLVQVAASRTQFGGVREWDVPATVRGMA
eukprot:8300311-Alexandrium_andersonii.AAC.1